MRSENSGVRLRVVIGIGNDNHHFTKVFRLVPPDDF